VWIFRRSKLLFVPLAGVWAAARFARAVLGGA
jgi:hypothetical protein